MRHRVLCTLRDSDCWLRHGHGTRATDDPFNRPVGGEHAAIRENEFLDFPSVRAQETSILRRSSRHGGD